MLPALLLLSLAAEPQVFHGWSKDGSWLVYEERGANELVELYFCATQAELRPSWPAALNEADREDVGGLSCVHFLDPNKAPWQWKVQLVVPPAGRAAGGVQVLKELVTDGEAPGFQVQAGDKRQTCYASGLKETSALQQSWVQASGRFAAALVDGAFHHCLVTVRGAAPAPRPGKR